MFHLLHRMIALVFNGITLKPYLKNMELLKNGPHGRLYCPSMRGISEAKY